MTFASIAYPEVRFSLIHGKRQVFDYPPVSSLKERIFQVFGKSLLERLLRHQGIEIEPSSSFM
jgi:DNA mismatch repair protein MutL